MQNRDVAQCAKVLVWLFSLLFTTFSATHIIGKWVNSRELYYSDIVVWAAVVSIKITFTLALLCGALWLVILIFEPISKLIVKWKSAKYLKGQNEKR